MQNQGLIGLGIVLATMGRWFWRAWAVKVPKTPTAFQAAVGLGLGFGRLAVYQGHNDPFAPWASGIALVFLYLSVTGAQRTDGAMINVGDALPRFSALDDGHLMLESSSLDGSRVLLKFFRGHW